MHQCSFIKQATAMLLDLLLLSQRRGGTICSAPLACVAKAYSGLARPTGDTQSMHARACIRSSLLDLLTKPCNPNNQQLFNSLSPHLTDYWRGLANVPECQIFIRVRSQRHRQQMAICSMKGRNTKHIFHLKKNWFPECFIIIVE